MPQQPRLAAALPAHPWQLTVVHAPCPLPLPQVPPELYRALPLALAPVLGNPINLLAAGMEGRWVQGEWYSKGRIGGGSLKHVPGAQPATRRNRLACFSTK